MGRVMDYEESSKQDSTVFSYLKELLISHLTLHMGEVFDL